MSNFAYVSGDPDNLTGGAGANMVDIQGPFVDLATWLNTDLQPRVAAAVPSFVTSLPVGATDGQEIYYLADDTNGVVWHLRYRAASASSYKWEFLGGSNLIHQVDTSESTSSVTYVDLTTVGPTLTAPLAGDYEIEWGTQVQHSVVGAYIGVGISLAGGAVTEPFETMQWHEPVANQQDVLARSRRKIGLAAATTIKVQYRTSGATASVFNRWLRVRPVRVG